MTLVYPMLRGLRRDHFPVGVFDVPWNYVVRSDKGLGKSAERHYDTMTLAEIEAMPVGQFFKKDSRIFFWITGPFLAIGAHVPIMRAWGYEPVSIFNVWAKPVAAYYQNPHGVTLDDHLFEMNMGFTSRQNAEYVVLGRRGDPPERLSKSIRQIIVEPAREHSRKPDKFYQIVERYAQGPYLELFGRTRKKGWTVRGNQLGMFR